jgi:hypothetical protein
MAGRTRGLLLTAMANTGFVIDNVPADEPGRVRSLAADLGATVEVNGDGSLTVRPAARH